MKQLILVALIALSNLTTNAQGKTVYVSTDEIFQSIYQTRIADSIVTLEANKLSGFYDYQKQNLNDSIQKFFTDSLTMNEKQKEEKRTALQAELADMGRLEANIKDSIQKLKEEIVVPIRKLMMDVILATGKSKGATTILYRENAILIPPGSDITAEVIKKINAIKPKKVGK